MSQPATSRGRMTKAAKVTLQRVRDLRGEGTHEQTLNRLRETGGYKKADVLDAFSAVEHKRIEAEAKVRASELEMQFTSD